eukprot:UN25909
MQRILVLKNMKKFWSLRYTTKDGKENVDKNIYWKQTDFVEKCVNHVPSTLYYVQDKKKWYGVENHRYLISCDTDLVCMEIHFGLLSIEDDEEFNSVWYLTGIRKTYVDDIKNWTKVSH